MKTPVFVTCSYPGMLGQVKQTELGNDKDDLIVEATDLIIITIIVGIYNHNRLVRFKGKFYTI